MKAECSWRRTISLIHAAIEISTPREFMVTTHYPVPSFDKTFTLEGEATTPPFCSDSLNMFLGFGVLLSRSLTVHTPPFPFTFSLLRLVLTQLTPLSHSCYRRLGLHLAVGENSSADHC